MDGSSQTWEEVDTFEEKKKKDMPKNKSFQACFCTKNLKFSRAYAQT